MSTSAPSSIMATKVEESIKRRFDAAMRARGTTTSAMLREAIYRYLNELDAGEEHPQFRLELDRAVGRGK
ncbi:MULTISPECIES: ribbon-helix-helix protein, CopG family [Pseudomonas]|jgi:hypothetical protein|uniref:ribbon-helix-helix protein, CopG family n=2 Tax=Pseudomonas TaxID=286 RepID=UPI0035B1EF1C